MTDADLRTQLRALGIDGRTWRIISILPLVQVAWADGSVKPAERRRVLEIATEHGVLVGDGRLVLEGWLRHRPSDAYFARGLTALVAIAERGGLRSCGMSGAELVDHGREVAQAAGGFFGVLGTVHADERAALDDLRRMLGDEPDSLFRALREAPPRPPEDLAPFDEEEEITESVAVVGGRDAGPCSPREAAQPALRIVEGLPAAVVPLRNPTSIGRKPQATISAPDDAALSRQHCHLHRSDGRWYVVDLSSQNGTWVDGERILERRLFGGEELRAGGLRIEVALDGDCG